MDVHIRVKHWVLWWFYVSVALGAVAIVNILGRDLSRRQERIILFMGVIHWVLGGLVCYVCDSVQIQTSSQKPEQTEVPRVNVLKEWHAASDFLFPGGRKSLLPPKY